MRKIFNIALGLLLIPTLALAQINVKVAKPSGVPIALITNSALQTASANSDSSGVISTSGYSNFAIALYYQPNGGAGLNSGVRIAIQIRIHTSAPYDTSSIYMLGMSQGTFPVSVATDTVQVGRALTGNSGAPASGDICVGLNPVVGAQYSYPWKRIYIPLMPVFGPIWAPYLSFRFRILAGQSGNVTATLIPIN